MSRRSTVSLLTLEHYNWSDLPDLHDAFAIQEALLAKLEGAEDEMQDELDETTDLLSSVFGLMDDAPVSEEPGMSG